MFQAVSLLGSVAVDVDGHRMDVVFIDDYGLEFDRFTVLNRGKTLGTAQRGQITPEELQDLMAGGQEMAQLEGSLGGTV